MITSPCVKVCKVDEQGRCQGCERTSDEISNWMRMSDEERARVKAELPARARARYGDASLPPWASSAR